MAKTEVVARRRRLCGLALLGVLAGALATIGPVQALAPAPVFANPLTYEAGNARGLVVADFTGDGRNDVLVRSTDTSATERPDRIYLFSQGPDGRLARTDVIDLGTSWNYGPGIAAGDLDGDGLSDAAVVSGTSIEVLLQRAGRLVRGQAITDVPFRWLEAAEVTGDGRADIVGAGLDGVRVLRNLGGATFAVPDTLTTEVQHDLQLGDVTGDGRADIVSCSPSRGVMVFAQGAGGLQEHRASGVCLSLTLADVNGDGRTDVAFVGPDYHDDRLVLLLQQADGTLADGPSYLTASWAAAVRAGDTNGDGRRDVVVLHGESQWGLAVHTQASDHTLDPGRLFDVPDAFDARPPALAVGDVNGDDRPDIAVADNETGLVVLLGRPAAPPTTTSTSVLPPASPYGRPNSSTPDIFGALQTYRLPYRGGAESVAAGDFNGDGRTDVAAVNDPIADTPLQVFVFYQGADGSLSRSVAFDTDGELDSASLPINPSVVAGDLDGDGRDDLVLKMGRGMDIFIQRDGGFGDRIYREVTLYSRVDIADLDGDGKGDLVVSGPEGISLHRSVGIAQFAPPVTVDAGVTSKEVAIGDVSGDGRPDIVIAEDNVPNGDVIGNVVVYRQRADHSFAPGVWLDAGGRYGTVAVGDFNGDGRGDIAVSHSADRSLAQMVRIFVQGLGGTLTPLADELRHTYSAMPLRAGDVDGDGLTDLVAVEDGGEVHAWVQKNGRLVLGQTRYLNYATRFPSTALALADFTGDGRLDVAAANYNAGVEVLRNVTTAGAFHPLPPARILDTRTGLGAPAARLGAGGTINLQVAGAGGVPVGAAGVVLNVTVTEPTAGSFLTAWPTSENRPLASNLNYAAGQTVPNLVNVSIGLEGKVSLYNLAGSTHVIADVAGWYGVDYADVGSRYTPVTPARILDTRTGVGAVPGKVGPSGTLGLQVGGRGGVPASGASAVVLNVTVTEPTAGSFLTAWPAGQGRPLASNLNFSAGQTVPNLVVVKLGAGGVVNLFNLAGATHVIADVAGWFGPGIATPTGSFSSGGPVRIADTREGSGTKLGPGATLAVGVIDRAGVPPSGVAAVVLNVTVTEPTAGSFLTVWPHGEARPLASNLNYEAGQTVPNQVIVKVGASGAVDLYNFAGATHVVVDLAGWYQA